MSAPLSKTELYKKFPLTLYTEKYWEIYDEVEARVIAFFFSEEEAMEYLDFKNKKNQESGE